MKSPHNPIADDIVEWAYDAAALEPQQDWDLIISTLPYESLFVRLAAADDCPKQDYFLQLLYLMVGDAVRTGYNTWPRENLEKIIRASSEIASRNHKLYLWVKRSEELISHPEMFDYNDWCAGGLAGRT